MRKSPKRNLTFKGFSMKVLTFTLITLSFTLSHAGRLDHFHRDISRTGFRPPVKKPKRRGVMRRTFDPKIRIELDHNLVIAIREGNLDLARESLDRGANPNQKIDSEYDSTTPLEQAAKKDNYDMAKLLFLKGAKKGRDKALSIATWRGSYEMTELLLKNGANPNEFTEASNPLYIAITKPVWGRLRLAKLLLDRGANPNQKIYLKYRRYTTPLEQAAKEGNHEMAKLLLERGAKEGRDKALSTAVRKSYEMTELLLKNGANPNAFTGSPENPLYVAITQPVEVRLRLAKLLLEYGANPKQKISVKYRNP